MPWLNRCVAYMHKLKQLLKDVERWEHLPFVLVGPSF